MALFITFEGGEGSGKSIQARLLYRKLRQLAIPVILTHEPGVTSLGKRINHLLKWTQYIDISPVAELMMFNVSRAQLVKEVISEALKRGQTVICDRFYDSTTAYQGYGRGLDIETVKKVNKIAAGGLTPNLTIFLDVPPEEGFRRKIKDKPDRFETESLDFHRRVREGFLKLAEDEPSRWRVINGEQDREIIAGIVWKNVSALIPAQD
jgi:dTMP kinase